MAANGLPTVQVLLDDVNNGGTFPYDVTAYYRWPEGYALTPRGRSAELQAPAQVTCTLTLVNTDGRFSLGSTSGGYGTLNVGRGIRVIATPQGGAASIRFTGFVQSWPTEWPGGGGEFAVARVTAVDAMAPWGRRVLRSMPEEEILRDTPSFYFTLGEPAGSAAAYDSTGSVRPEPLTRNASVLGDQTGLPSPVFGSGTGPGTDGLTALTYTAGSALIGAEWDDAGGSFLTWLECAFLTSATAGTLLQAFQNEFLHVTLDGTGAGELSVFWDGIINDELDTPNKVNDGHTHVVAVAIRNVVAGAGNLIELYLDGALVASYTDPGGDPIPCPNDGGVILGAFDGTLSHVAGGNGVAPSAARFQAHATALLTGFDGEASGRRIERLSAYEGSSPISVLDVSQTTVPFVDITGKSVAEAIQQVADAEVGTAYVDGQGRTIAHNRTRGPLKVTPDLVLSASSDAISGDLVVEGDDQQVVNYAAAARVGDGTQQFLSKASTVKGRYQSSIGEYLVSTLSEVFDRMSWLVNTRAEPVPRIPSLPLDLAAADASVQAAVLALDVDSRVQLTGLPTQTPGGTTADLSVIGYAETCSLAGWLWTGTCTPWLAYVQAAVLDNATYGRLDSTARLGI